MVEEEATRMVEVACRCHLNNLKGADCKTTRGRPRGDVVECILLAVLTNFCNRYCMLD